MVRIYKIRDADDGAGLGVTRVLDEDLARVEQRLHEHGMVLSLIVEDDVRTLHDPTDVDRFVAEVRGPAGNICHECGGSCSPGTNIHDVCADDRQR